VRWALVRSAAIDLDHIALATDSRVGLPPVSVDRTAEVELLSAKRNRGAQL
jgi:hypothetical protein